MTIKTMMNSVVMIALVAVINTQADDLYYSDSGPGYYPWDNVDGWIIYNSGGTHYNHLPTTNDNVMINATTPKAENGNALSVTNGVFAECNYFASGHQNFSGTAWFRLDGGSLTCRTAFVTGEGYPGLTTLESGNLYGGETFYIGSMSGGYGTVTNNGATADFANFILANYSAASPSVLVQTNGSMSSRGTWHVGYRGEALAEINGGTVSSAGNFYLGTSSGSDGTLLLNGGSVSSASDFRIGYGLGSYGTLMMNTGSVYSAGAFIVGSEIGSSGNLVLNGGSITGNTYAMIGRYGDAMAELNTGALHCTGNFYIGDYSGSSGVLTNNGAQLSTDADIRLGYSTGSFGRLVQNGGSITGTSAIVIGGQGQALAELNTGNLYSAGGLFIGSSNGGVGVVTNNGVAISVNNIYAGAQSGAYGRLVHNSGTLVARDTLQIGRYGGNSEFEVDAPFSVNALIIGTGIAPSIPGTGTVTVAENAVGTIDDYLRINNGELYMQGGEIHLQNVGNENRTNLYVRTGQDRYGKIQGWGSFTNVNDSIALRMVNDGQIIADGNGVERDLNLNQFAVVDNHLSNGPTGTNGWYAINKGRVLYPRTYTTFPAGSARSWGDHYAKTVPEMVNSVALTFSSSINCAVRGGLCASDRSDIPSSLPAGNFRPIGIWCIGAYKDKLLMTQASFSSVSLDFRYDHTQVKPNDQKLKLYRYDGADWVKVGECEPNSNSLISTDTSLTSVATGDYNIGWFAVLAVEMNGTLILVN